ncbi:MAG: protein-tyrosine kinase [Clostridiales bacterium]|nr:protein-tyrosine kinase [Candidatus Blautia equi]
MDFEKKQANDEIEIDLMEIISLLLHRAWIIILAGLTVGLATIAVTMFLITPKFKSTTSMYVLNRQNGETLSSSDMQTSLSLTKDYVELIKSRTVTEGVISQLGLDMTSAQLLGMMSVSNKTDTRILSITVEDVDPYRACDIANALREVGSSHIKSVMDIDAVNMVDAANIPQTKSSPNTTKNGMLGVFAGAAIAIFIILLNYLINDTIQTQEDVEKYLGLSVLGAIPMVESEKKSKKRKHKGRRR